MGYYDTPFVAPGTIDGKPWIANIGQGAAERVEGNSFTVLVSITEPGVPARLRTGWADLLRLEFQDYDPLKLIPGTELLNPEHKIPENAQLFARRQASRLARFARKHRGKNILVHCAAGISRSGGVVEALLEAFPEYEDRGWPRHPNNHVKTLLKRALGLIPLGAEP